MNNLNPGLIYGAVLHIGALVALTVLIAMGKLSWAEGGPILGALVGIGVGVPLTPVISGSNLITPAPQTPAPAAPVPSDTVQPAAPAAA